MAFGGKRALQSQIRHGEVPPEHTIISAGVLRFSENARLVASRIPSPLMTFPDAGNKQRTVRVAVKATPKRALVRRHPLLQFLQGAGTAFRV